MKDKIQKDLIESMKSGSKKDVEILRFITSLIKKEEKDKNKDFNDTEVIQVLKKAIKRNQDAFNQFSKAGRNDLAEKEQMEIDIISRYLPSELSESAVEDLVRKVISEVRARDQKDIGKVMAHIKQNHADSVDMGLASKLVKTILSAN